MAGKERFHSQVARSPMSDFVVGDLEVMKFDFCDWKIEQEEDGSIKVDIEHAMKEISDKQVDKDPSKDKVHSTVGKRVCLEGEGGTTSLIPWSSKKASRVAKSALPAEIMAASEVCDEGHWNSC